MIGTIIGGAVGLAGQAIGQITQARARRRQKENLEEQKAANQAWYDRRYNEDATQRADAQALLNRTEEVLKKRMRSARGVQGVMGGSDAAIAAEGEVASNALANTTNAIIDDANNRKDAIEERYQEKDSQLTAQLDKLEEDRRGQIASAVQGALGVAGSIGSALSEMPRVKDNAVIPDAELTDLKPVQMEPTNLEITSPKITL